jgi:hypothetical protein
MNSSSISDREAILKAIKRKPGVTILEIAQSLDIPRSSIAAHIRHLQCDGVIKAVPLPARPGVDESRSGYELAPKLVVPKFIPEPKPVVKVKPVPVSRPAIPAQWDALSFLFGRATVKP